MTEPRELWDAVRCLQQLGGAAKGVSAAEVARSEGLEAEAVGGLLGRLRKAGLVEVAGAGRYRLARPPEQIRVTDLWSVLGGASPVPGPAALSIRDLLDWESRIFTEAGVARAA